MADIVVGIASSHTPQLSSGVDMWPDHADRDRRHPWLLGRDGEYHSYDEILALAEPGVLDRLVPAVWDAKYQRCQDAIGTLTQRLAKAEPDVAVVIGDDQRELFLDDGIPALACFAGEELVDFPPDQAARERMPAGIRAASWAVHADHEQRHRVDAALSRHVAEELARADFDIMLFTQQSAGRSLGHAFTFPRYRLGLPATDILVGGTDGLVAVPASRAAEVLDIAREIATSEERIRATVLAGGRLDEARASVGYHDLQYRR